MASKPDDVGNECLSLSRRRLFGILALALVPSSKTTARPLEAGKVTDLSALLEPVRSRYGLPALAAAVIASGTMTAQGAVGVRKHGSSILVTVQDQFHFGSDTKAMTATLCGMQVERGKLSWDTPLPVVFPEMKMATAYRAVTLDHLLAHRSGFSSESWPQGKTFGDMHALPGSPLMQRAAYVRAILQEAPIVPPGRQFVYSNRNYAVAGAMLERVTRVAWEKLIRRDLFAPLGMQSAGFGAMGTPGRIDQPWQHKIEDGKLVAIGPGSLSDNPPVIGPAGTVHCTISDWAKFVALHLLGEHGTSRLLAPATVRRLHAPQFGGDYAGGWIVTNRDWGGGRVLTHAGSNTQNYAVAWVAPLKNFAALVMTNQGGDAAAEATDTVAAALIGRFL